MRVSSAILAVLLHVAVFMGVRIAMPFLGRDEPPKMMIIPLDLEMGDTTNFAAISDTAREEEVDAPQPAAEAAAPPPQQEDVENLPDESKPEPKKDEAKKPEAAPTPPKPEKQEKQSTGALLGKILEGVDRKAADPREKTGPKPNFNNVDDRGAPRDGMGDPSKNSAAIADQIMSQLLARRCWTDQDDMADARRLRAVIGIRLARPGKVSQMTLISPSPRPANDQVLNVFIARAEAALNKCNIQGFQVPEAYFKAPFTIELDFRP